MLPQVAALGKGLGQDRQTDRAMEGGGGRESEREESVKETEKGDEHRERGIEGLRQNTEDRAREPEGEKAKRKHSGGMRFLGGCGVAALLD